MHTRKSRDYTVTKFAAFAYVVCGTMCRKFCSKRTTFDKVILKKTKNIDGLSSRTRAWPPSVLILEIYGTYVVLPSFCVGRTKLEDEWWSKYSSESVCKLKEHCATVKISFCKLIQSVCVK